MAKHQRGSGPVRDREVTEEREELDERVVNIARVAKALCAGVRFPRGGGWRQSRARGHGRGQIPRCADAIRKGTERAACHEARIWPARPDRTRQRWSAGDCLSSQPPGIGVTAAGARCWPRRA
jgi:ribosomal protein S5